jgi:heterotetrameric sarcosine oxidase gamma subunit
MLTHYAIAHAKTLPGRAEHLEATIGFSEAGRSALIGQIECLWIGPGEWLLIVPAEQKDQLADLRRSAADKGAATADAEDRLTILALDMGADQVAGLTGLKLTDLCPRHVSRTRLADIPVVIAAGTGAMFRLLFDRSYAPHVRAWLDRAL